MRALQMHSAHRLISITLAVLALTTATASPSPSERPKQNDAITCPLGSFLESTEFEVKAGEGGAVATNSKCVPCPAGRFGNTTGLDSERCSGICEAGYFCAPGSTSATQAPCGADFPLTYTADTTHHDMRPETAARWFCPAGTTKRREAPQGWYTLPNGTDYGTRKFV